MSLPRIIVSENLGHALARMTAADEEPIRTRARAGFRQRLIAEFSPQRLASELCVTAPIQDRRDRRLHDAIGHSATSQFERHTQPAVPSSQQELLRAAPRQFSVVYITEIAEGEKRGGDLVRREATAREVRLQLGGGARSAREETDRLVARA
jgi:hypothetical protein